MTTIPMPLMRTLIKNRCSAGLLAVSLGAFGSLAIAPADAIAMQDQNQAQDDGSFWTRFVPSEDTRLIFVSSSEGSDTNSGLTPDRPVKSLQKAYDLLRDGYPDWMLLKRGDVWYESFPFWIKSGRAEDEKLVVGAYGESDDRPQVRPDPNSSGLRNHGEDRVQHVAFVGFHLEPHNRTADDGAAGISWLREANDILFEDLYIAGFSNNINLQAWPSDNLVQNIRLNGCVIVDAWSRNSHSQGLYASSINGLTIENSVFDHNGWNLDMGAEPTIFNRNAYIQYTNSNVVTMNNIFMRGASTGIQMRSGGILINNLFIANPVSFTLGAPNGYDLGYGVDAIVMNNTILHGTSIQNSGNSPRSIGALVHNIKNVQISNNIFAHNEIGYNGQSISFSGSDNGADALDVGIADNIFYAWHGPVEFGLEQTPSIDDNIVVTNNLFIADLESNNGRHVFDKSIISTNSSASYTTFSVNQYHYFGMHDAPFQSGSSMSISEWSDSHEPSAEFYALTTLPDGFTITDYLSSIGLDGSIDAYADRARALSRSNTNDNIRPEAVHNWYRDNLSSMAE